MNRQFLGYWLLVGAAAASLLAAEAAGWETYGPGRPTLESLSTGGWRPAAPNDGRKRCYVDGRQVDCNTGGEAGRIDAGGGGPIRGTPIVALVAVVFRPPPEEQGPGSHSSRGCGVLIAADFSRPGRPYLVLTCAHLQDGHFRPWIELAPGPIGGGFPARILADDRAFDLMALEVDDLPGGTLVLPLGTERAPVGTCVATHGLGPDNPRDFRSTVGLIGAGKVTRWENGFVYFEGRPSDGMSGGPVFWPGNGLQGILHGGSPGEAQAAGLDSIRRFLDGAGIRIDGARYTLAAADQAAADLVPLEPAQLPIPDEETTASPAAVLDPPAPEYRRPAAPDPISTPQDLTDAGGGVGSAAGLADAVIPPTSTADGIIRSVDARFAALAEQIAELVAAATATPPATVAPGPSATPRSPTPTSRGSAPPRSPAAPATTDAGVVARADDAGGSLWDLVAAVAPYALTAAGAGSLTPAVWIALALYQRRRRRKQATARRGAAAAAAGSFPDETTVPRDLSEVAQLLRLSELEGRSPLRDAFIGMSVLDELDRTIHAGPDQAAAFAAQLRRRLLDRLNETAPLAT